MISADRLRRQPRAKTGSPFYSKRITSKETSTPDTYQQARKLRSRPQFHHGPG